MTLRQHIQTLIKSKQIYMVMNALIQYFERQGLRPAWIKTSGLWIYDTSEVKPSIEMATQVAETLEVFICTAHCFRFLQAKLKPSDSELMNTFKNKISCE